MARRRSSSRRHRADPGAPPAPVDLTKAAAGPSVRVLLVVAAAGFAARLVLSAVSWGSNDTAGFLRFAAEIDAFGLLGAYRVDPLFNHPPIPAYWAPLAYRLGGGDQAAFPFVFRLPVILADAVVALLLGRIALARGLGPRGAALAAAAYAWNPAAILVSAYHCNTDSVYAMLCLLAVYLFQDRGRPFWGGVALGLAVNVKLIPVLLIPGLALSARSWRELALFAAGLAVMTLPFLPPLLAEPAFATNVLGYRSLTNRWGVPLLLELFAPRGDIGSMAATDAAATSYRSVGTWLTLGAVAAWAIIARVAGAARWDRYAVSAVSLALFLVLAPGFGVQYLVVVVPLLHAAAPRFADGYGALAGTFLLVAYWLYWDGLLPLSSAFFGPLPLPLGLLGLLPWAALVAFVATAAVRGNRAEPCAEH